MEKVNQKKLKEDLIQNSVDTPVPGSGTILCDTMSNNMTAFVTHDKEQSTLEPLMLITESCHKEKWAG
jgi:hypothetical protein